MSSQPFPLMPFTGIPIDVSLPTANCALDDVYCATPQKISPNGEVIGVTQFTVLLDDFGVIGT